MGSLVPPFHIVRGIAGAAGRCSNVPLSFTVWHPKGSIVTLCPLISLTRGGSRGRLAPDQMQDGVGLNMEPKMEPVVYRIVNSYHHFNKIYRHLLIQYYRKASVKRRVHLAKDWSPLPARSGLQDRVRLLRRLWIEHKFSRALTRGLGWAFQWSEGRVGQWLM